MGLGTGRLCQKHLPGAEYALREALAIINLSHTLFAAWLLLPFPLQDDYSDADDDLERSPGHLYPGDVVVHHGLTIHHASANLTAKRRRALTINYVAEHVAHSIVDDLYQLRA